MFNYSKSVISVWRAWLVWGAATLFVFFQFLLQTSTSVMIPAFMHQFHIDPLQVGLLSSSYFYSYLTLQLPGGMLADRFGARAVLTVGITLCVIACWLFAHAQNFYMAEASRILMGLGSAPVIGTTFALVAHWFPSERFGLVIGLTDTLGMLGGITGQAYLAAWVERVGWQQTLVACGLGGIIIGALIVGVVRDKPVHPTAVTGLEKPNPWWALLTVIKLPQVWLNGIFVGLIWGAAIGFTGLWSVPFLQIQYHLSLPTAALASSMVFVGIAIFAPVVGWLSNYKRYRKGFLGVSTLLSLIILSAVIYLPHLPLSGVFVGLFLYGCSISNYIVPFAIVREITTSQARGTAMAFTNMMSLLIGAPILQPLIGYLLKLKKHNIALTSINLFSTQDFHNAFVVFPSCILLAFIIVMFLRSETY